MVTSRFALSGVPLCAFFAPAYGFQKIRRRVGSLLPWSLLECSASKVDLVGHQVSARGGIVRVQVRGDRVHLGGNAITIMRGELRGKGEPCA